MPDITNTPVISDIFKQLSFQMGYAVDARFAALDATSKAYVDSQVAALTGQDAAFLTIVNNLKAITDAVPGTPEWDQGQNLYTLLTTNYVALTASLKTTSDAVATLNAWKDSFSAAVNTAIAAANARIDQEVTDRQAAITGLQGQIDAANTALAAANAARQTLADTLAATDNAQTADIVALKTRMTTAEGNIASIQSSVADLNAAMALRVQEITALQAKRDDFESRISMLESKFVGLNANSAFAEFNAGLNGHASPSGIAAPVL